VVGNINQDGCGQLKLIEFISAAIPQENDRIPQPRRVAPLALSHKTIFTADLITIDKNHPQKKTGIIILFFKRA